MWDILKSGGGVLLGVVPTDTCIYALERGVHIEIVEECGHQLGNSVTLST